MPPKGGKQQFVYYWQGKDSTQDERGVSALKVPLARRRGPVAVPVEVRVGEVSEKFLKSLDGDSRSAC